MYGHINQSVKGTANNQLAANYSSQAVRISSQTTYIDGKNPPKMIEFDGKSWNYLGSGTYNHAYKSENSDSVIKIPKRSVSKMDAAKRAVRVFKEVNPCLKKRAKLCGQFWESPFIKPKKEITPHQKAKFILKMYKNHGRLILDGYCGENILLNKKDGRAVCIDPGLVVRRGSIASENYWYKQTDSVLERRKSHIYYMLKHVDIEEYREPILMTLALDYFDRKSPPIKLKDVSHDKLLKFGQILSSLYSSRSFEMAEEAELNSNGLQKLKGSSKFKIKKLF